MGLSTSKLIEDYINTAYDKVVTVAANLTAILAVDAKITDGTIDLAATANTDSVASAAAALVSENNAATSETNAAASAASITAIEQQFAAAEQLTPDMTVRVSAGNIITATALIVKTEQSTATLVAPSAGNDRIDRLAIDINTGTLVTIAGTEDPSPTAPAYSANHYPVCQILLDEATTTILDTDITDERTSINKYATFDTDVFDVNGNEILGITATASAINHLSSTNAAIGNGPTLSAIGDDTDIDLNLVSKGSGVIKNNGFTIPEYETTTVAADGSFTSGNLTCTRIGNMVTITSDADLTHASADNASSSIGLIPAAYRPTHNTENIFGFAFTRIDSVAITNGGLIGVSYRDWTGANIATTQTLKAINISYTIA